jgi:hypothetical protein
MARAPRPTNPIILKLREDLANLKEQARNAELTPRGRQSLNEEIRRAAQELNNFLAELDPVRRPGSVFDPGNPRTIGFFVALGLTAQVRLPLGDLHSFYGAGIYALYYEGDFPKYAPISGTETPIYVGMAVYGGEGGHDPAQQGTPLAGRLGEHKRNIERAIETLAIDDFKYRSLVIRSGWESSAENYLIRLFKPIWNRETNIIFGFGKHGDSAETRRNRRSPWDTLHQGRSWAGAEALTDAKSPDRIADELERHFAATRVYKSHDEIIDQFVETLRQD